MENIPSQLVCRGEFALESEDFGSERIVGGGGGRDTAVMRVVRMGVRRAVLAQRRVLSFEFLNASVTREREISIISLHLTRIYAQQNPTYSSGLA